MPFVLCLTLCLFLVVHHNPMMTFFPANIIYWFSSDCRGQSVMNKAYHSQHIGGFGPMGVVILPALHACEHTPHTGGFGDWLPERSLHDGCVFSNLLYCLPAVQSFWDLFYIFSVPSSIILCFVASVPLDTSCLCEVGMHMACPTYHK